MPRKIPSDYGYNICLNCVSSSQFSLKNRKCYCDEAGERTKCVTECDVFGSKEIIKLIRKGKKKLSNPRSQVRSDLIKINKRLVKKKFEVIMDPDIMIKEKLKKLDDLFNNYCRDIKKVLEKKKEE